MKKLINLILSLMLILFPVAALCDHNIGTTVYVTTERLSDGTNESICYSEAFTCLGNLTWMANSTLSSENFGMTIANCRGRATIILPVYSTVAENLYVIDGHCDSATLSGAWSYGCVKAGTDLVTYVDAVETNQATAETNANNRSASDRAYLDSQILTRASTSELSNGTAVIIADIDTQTAAVTTNVNAQVLNSTTWITAEGVANTATINTNINNQSAVQIANVDSKYTLTATDIGNRTAKVLADVWAAETAIIADNLNRTTFLVNMIANVDLYVFQNSTRYCRLWGYTAWPATQTACLTRYVTGVGG